MTTRGGLGPQGFRGPTGEKGPKGPTGPTGNNGVGDPYWQLNSISNNLSPINNYSINKSIIDGLAKVENTSDLNKQISTSCQDALNSKINNTDIDNQISGAINNLVLDAESNLNTLKEIANALNNDSHLATTLTNSIELKAPKISPTFTGTVSGITSEMIKPNNIVINTSDLDSSENYILNTNNFKDGSTIISTSIISTLIPSAISSPLLGNGLSTSCNALCSVSNSDGSTDIYIGGDFTEVYNSNYNMVSNTIHICKYNSVSGSYSAVGKGLSFYSSSCFALCAVTNSDGNTDIYIGGNFTTATNSDNSIVNVKNICKYNTGTKSYSAVGNGLNGGCYALCAVSNSDGNTDIYIGGYFTTATNSDNSVVANTSNICKYNTATKLYSKVGNGLNGGCVALCSVSNSNSNTDIYIGGVFTTATNSDNSVVDNTKYICKYNTATKLYSKVGNGLNGGAYRYCLALCAGSNSDGNTDIYIGGVFPSATNSDSSVVPYTSNICKYNTGTKSYSAVGKGFSSTCRSLCAVSNLNGTTDIYIGGDFSSATNSNGTIISNTSKICKYNSGSGSYSAVGIILSDYCSNLCAVPKTDGTTDIYIGGVFWYVYINTSGLESRFICKINNNNNLIPLYYKNTLISNINYTNTFEVIQKNTTNSKEYITLVGNNNTTTNLIF